ncbi:Coenzyme F420 hydrogenase/dehydrogenase, beta subunit C-terminal domain [Megasphaera elsdenii]|uniref:Coenzyme F420 hydrogenase/dehydrogenase, beta subunit C-terminal domain n=1 Tax=Megasphaera elsdenii TaxID=907 RepID=UPI0006C79890|nr:Coenzyme F420 hydrogenase/dehydrogenase, beta subunit C-terminal domain [Megasphaera elsdenii]
MYVHDKKEDCCGCTACMTICSVNAITMKNDEEGFKYPKINEKKCIHCNMCRKVCDFVKQHDWDALPRPAVYAAKQKSDKERAASQSGGLFAALSDAVLAMGGVVYGAVYDGEWNVIHKRAETKEVRNEMRGSKYVQSDMQDAFHRVGEDLKNGRIILFSGTHCQCAGLKSLLETCCIKTENLYLVDIVCHGGPSPSVYKAFRDFMENKYHGEIKGFEFRNKKFGWHNTVESTWINGQEYDTMLYRDIFYGDNALRPSCYQCPYKNVVHTSDITIGDFWGIEKWAKDFDDTKGISLVLINTPKGKILLNRISNNIALKESNTVDCLQPCLQKPVSRPATRDQFWQDFENKPFEYILTHYTNDYGWKTHVKKTIKKTAKTVLPGSAIVFIKKVLRKS